MQKAPIQKCHVDIEHLRSYQVLNLLYWCLQTSCSCTLPHLKVLLHQLGPPDTKPVTQLITTICSGATPNEDHSILQHVCGHSLSILASNIKFKHQGPSVHAWMPRTVSGKLSLVDMSFWLIFRQKAFIHLPGFNWSGESPMKSFLGYLNCPSILPFALEPKQAT